MFRENFDMFYPVTIPAILPKSEPEDAPRKTRLAVILGRARALVARRGKGHQSARLHRHLKTLSDHLLKDIGVERGDLTRADLGPLIKDPTRLRY